MTDEGSSSDARTARREVERDVLLWVALGGALGALLRHAVDLAVPVGTGDFPWGTFGINVGGALALGGLHAYVPAHPRTPRRVRAVLGAGLLSGFTTFSVYAEQTRSLLGSGREAVALVYVVATVGAAVLAAEAGRRIVPTGPRGPA